MSKKPVVGFIGLCFMGQGMAKNFRKAGYELWVRGSSNRVTVESHLTLGALQALSPKAMAEQRDIIHICLSTSEHIEKTWMPHRAAPPCKQKQVSSVRWLVAMKRSSNKSTPSLPVGLQNPRA